MIKFFLLVCTLLALSVKAEQQCTDSIMWCSRFLPHCKNRDFVDIYKMSCTRTCGYCVDDNNDDSNKASPTSGEHLDPFGSSTKLKPNFMDSDDQFFNNTNSRNNQYSTDAFTIYNNNFKQSSDNVSSKRVSNEQQETQSTKRKSRPSKKGKDYLVDDGKQPIDDGLATDGVDYSLLANHDDKHKNSSFDDSEKLKDENEQKQQDDDYHHSSSRSKNRVNSGIKDDKDEKKSIHSDGVRLISNIGGNADDSTDESIDQPDFITSVDRVDSTTDDSIDFDSVTSGDDKTSGITNRGSDMEAKNYNEQSEAKIDTKPVNDDGKTVNEDGKSKKSRKIEYGDNFHVYPLESVEYGTSSKKPSHKDSNSSSKHLKLSAPEKQYKSDEGINKADESSKHQSVPKSEEYRNNDSTSTKDVHFKSHPKSLKNKLQQSKPSQLDRKLVAEHEGIHINSDDRSEEALKLEEDEALKVEAKLRRPQENKSEKFTEEEADLVQLRSELLDEMIKKELKKTEDVENGKALRKHPVEVKAASVEEENLTHVQSDLIDKERINEEQSKKQEDDDDNMTSKFRKDHKDRKLKVDHHKSGTLMNSDEIKDDTSAEVDDVIKLKESREESAESREEDFKSLEFNKDQRSEASSVAKERSYGELEAGKKNAVEKTQSSRSGMNDGSELHIIETSKQTSKSHKNDHETSQVDKSIQRQGEDEDDWAVEEVHKLAVRLQVEDLPEQEREVKDSEFWV